MRIQSGDALLFNLKKQLEAFNKTTFSAKEFDAVLNHLAKGNVFEKAKSPPSPPKFRKRKASKRACCSRCLFDNG